MMRKNYTNNIQDIHSMIRVDQAGEYGAVQIYKGQLNALSKSCNDDCLKIIEHMKKQEIEHLATFNDLMIKNQVRPTLLQPLWHIAGYSLGYISGMLGKNAAMACTVAVEEVIDEHYQSQEQILANINGQEELKRVVKKFRQEELEHKEIGLQHGAENAPAYPLLSFTIKSASKLAIWLSKRL